MKDKNILLISPEPWGENYVSKHHYAQYLAKNNTVYFLNPPNGFSRTLSGISLTKLKIKDNLTVIDYKNILPKINILPKKAQAKVYSKQAKMIQAAIGIKTFDIIWSFDPFRFFNQKVWQAEKTIYHSVDFHPAAKFEKEICATSDLLLGVTDLVIDEMPVEHSKVHLISHGADVDNFHTDNSIVIPGDHKIKACYTGNLHKNIDYDILFKTVTLNTKVDFIIIGPERNSNLSKGNTTSTAILKNLKALPNIFFIGSVPSHLLMSYLSKCHINLVLFKKDFEKMHCSPHKLMAYFFSGNITVSNYIDAHKNTDTNIILMEKDISNIPALISSVSANINEYNSEKYRELRKDFAIKNSYQNKLIEISIILDKQ